MDYKEQLRQNEIYQQSVISIEMIKVMLNETTPSTGRTMWESIEHANKKYRENYIKVRNSVLGLVDWNIRPHVLYRVNKYYQHILF